MSKIKRIVICVFILIAVLAVIISINPYKRYRKQQIEKQLILAINTGEIGEDISKSFEKKYKFAIKDSTNVYNIDNFIKYYINMLDTCILIKKGKAKERDIKEFLIKGDFIDLTVTRCEDEHFAKYIVENMTEKDINAYDNNFYHKMILGDLEKIFIHKSDKELEGWYLVGNEEKKIELHYNYYVRYTPNNKKNNADFDKILSFKIISPVGKIDKFDDKNDTLKSEIKYRTKNGDIKELKRVVILEKDGDNIYYSPEIYLSSLLYTQTIKPTISTGQHDYDEAERKKSEELNEFLDYVGGFPGQSENKDTREIVKSPEIDVPKFIKYNAKAVVTIYEYDDGSIEYRFKAVKTVDDKGSMSVKNYLLPYKNAKDVEDLLSQYLADSKRYNNDEKWLKENNYLYKEN